MRVSCDQKEQGFSLVEVMVAMLIIAIALPALMYQIGTQVDSAQRLRDQTIAGWVAQDQLLQMRLAASQGNVYRPGIYNGVELQAGRNWHWQLQVATTAVPGLYRYDMQVAAAENPSDSLILLMDYLAVVPSALSGDALLPPGDS
jgi:general secretion pathway protein I